MSKGVVPVTLNYGDVAYNVGDQFTVDNYSEMLSRINKLKSDTDYYREMAERAKERAKYLCDTKNRFLDVVHEVENRMNKS